MSRGNFLFRLAGKAQRYVRENPEKVRELADKAARTANKKTGGKYARQIDQAVRKVGGLTGNPDRRGPNSRGPNSRGIGSPRGYRSYDPHHSGPDFPRYEPPPR